MYPFVDLKNRANNYIIEFVSLQGQKEGFGIPMKWLKKQYPTMIYSNKWQEDTITINENRKKITGNNHYIYVNVQYTLISVYIR